MLVEQLQEEYENNLRYLGASHDATIRSKKEYQIALKAKIEAIDMLILDLQDLKGNILEENEELISNEQFCKRDNN